MAFVGRQSVPRMTSRATTANITATTTKVAVAVPNTATSAEFATFEATNIPIYISPTDTTVEGMIIGLGSGHTNSKFFEVAPGATIWLQSTTNTAVVNITWFSD